MTVVDRLKDSLRVWLGLGQGQGQGQRGLDQESVANILSDVPIPGTSLTIGAQNLLDKIEINKSKVTVWLKYDLLPKHTAELWGQLEVACQKAIKRIHKRASVMVEVKKNPEHSSHRESHNMTESDVQPLVHKSLQEVKNIIAVASGKGGVGKSSVAVNLAYALNADGFKVGILDADIYGPSVSIMTKAGRPSEMKEDLIIPPCKEGVKIIAPDMFTKPESAQMLRGPMVGQIARQLLTQVHWGELDYLILDYPPGTGDIQLTLSQTAQVSSAIIVTTPQDIAIADVRKAIDMFKTLKVPVLGLVETMSYFLCDSCEKKHQIFPSQVGAKGLSKECGAPLLGEIPFDTKLAESADKGFPILNFDTHSSGGAAFVNLAKLVVEEQDKLNRNSTEGLAQFSLEWKG